MYSMYRPLMAILQHRNTHRLVLAAPAPASRTLTTTPLLAQRRTLLLQLPAVHRPALPPLPKIEVQLVTSASRTFRTLSSKVDPIAAFAAGQADGACLRLRLVPLRPRRTRQLQERRDEEMGALRGGASLEKREN